MRNYQMELCNESSSELNSVNQDVFLAWALGEDFRVSLENLCAGSSEDEVFTRIQWRSFFKHGSGNKNVVETISDTSCQQSVESFNKPYAVAGRVVSIVTPSDGLGIPLNTSFKDDMGDYLSIPLFYKDGGRYVQIIGISNSTLTESYKPFESMKDDGKTSIQYFDLAQLLYAGSKNLGRFENPVVAEGIEQNKSAVNDVLFNLNRVYKGQEIIDGGRLMHLPKL